MQCLDPYALGEQIERLEARVRELELAQRLLTDAEREPPEEQDRNNAEIEELARAGHWLGRRIAHRWW